MTYFVHLDRNANGGFRLYVTQKIETTERRGLNGDGTLAPKARYTYVETEREGRRRAARLQRTLEQVARVAPFGQNGTPGVIFVDHRVVGNDTDLFYEEADFARVAAKRAAAEKAAREEKIRRQRAARKGQLARIKLRGGRHRIPLHQPAAVESAYRVPAHRIERTQWSDDVRVAAQAARSRDAERRMCAMG